MGKGKTRDSIFYTALELFSEYGYEQVSMRQIADAVGIAGGSIYNHFDGKGELFDAIVDYFVKMVQQYYDPIFEMVELPGDLSPLEILRMFIVDYTSQDMDMFLRLYRIIFTEQFHNPRLQAVFYETVIQKPVKAMTRILNLLMRNGAIPPCDSRLLAAVWNRCGLMFAALGAHKDMGNTNYQQYRQTGEALVQLVLNGAYPAAPSLSPCG